MKALNANVRGPLATQTLRMLGVCAVVFMLAASPAMAGGTARGSFTVGITVQSNPPAVLTPEQLNERNKMLYEEQKGIASLDLEQKRVADAGNDGSVNTSQSATETGAD
jgi:hypothetical protein